MSLLPILFLLATLIFPLITAHASAGCNKTCGSNLVQYPFGFSAGCHIHLNCSSHGEMLIGEFPIDIINKDNMKIIIAPKCNRSLDTLHQLYSKNYAPTTRNAILLSDCDSTPTMCKIPSTDVQTQFRSLKCDAKSSKVSNINCYSEGENQVGFLAYKNLTGQKCKYLMSSISAEAFEHPRASLDIQVVELGWWIEGRCHCSDKADCTKVESPDGLSGFRCHCKDGFDGDGYTAGRGCYKASSGCNLVKYISGQCGGKSRIAVLIGGSIALVSLMMVSLGLIYCCIRRHKHSSSRSIKSTKRRLSQATGISIPVYPYKEIERATNNFSDKQRLGTGAYGTVYAGKLHNDIWVAIKRIKSRDNESIEQVINEIKLLSTVSHPNLVRLLGCSIENGEQILVYEFMPNGTLCQHLHGEMGEGLTWSIRLTIVTQTAQAIAHLHSAIDPPIYHRDVKSSNILLDFGFRSKVADFGLSRLGKTEISHISTAPQGTPGYLDPQYHQNFHLSDKSDVYSFGVVLVEIITAMKVVDFSRPTNEVNLVALFTDRISKGRLEEIIDPFLEPNRDAWTLSSIHRVAELAFRCLAFHSDMRPSMMEVAAELEQISASKFATCEDIDCTAASAVSSSSSSSNRSEKPLNLSVKKAGMEDSGLFMLQTGTRSLDSMERIKYNSPMSVQDPWLSEQSSPSSNSLLSNAIQ